LLSPVNPKTDVKKMQSGAVSWLDDDENLCAITLEAPCAVLIEHEFWDGSDHLRIAHQREAAVVQDQSLSVHTRCYGRMVFLRREVSQDHDPHIVMGQPACSSATSRSVAAACRTVCGESSMNAAASR
jgi:hypothetical protein